MPEAPSIKEALTNIAAISACVAVVDNPTSHVEMLSKINAISVGALKALATFQPDGERREAIARLAHRFWSIHPSEIAAKNLTREEFYEREMTKILASGLVHDEAGIRRDEREAIARIIGGVAFRPKHISGEGMSETEKEKWLRARNVAYYTADQIIASGLVQDEAAIRKDEREKCAKIADREAEFWQDAESSSARIVAAAIRSARDGGAET